MQPCDLASACRVRPYDDDRRQFLQWLQRENRCACGDLSLGREFELSPWPSPSRVVVRAPSEPCLRARAADGLDEQFAPRSSCSCS